MKLTEHRGDNPVLERRRLTITASAFPVVAPGYHPVLNPMPSRQIRPFSRRCFGKDSVMR